MAERVGFEPTVPCDTPDFESGTIDHSATSPVREAKSRVRNEKRKPKMRFIRNELELVGMDVEQMRIQVRFPAGQQPKIATDLDGGVW